MKEFIFDEDQCCINPNRIEGGDKDFWFEILTACKDGHWYHGHHYWTRGCRDEWDVCLNTTSHATENEAVYKEIDCIIAFLKANYNGQHSRFGVPEKVFKQLNDLKEKCRHPQMTLDFFKYTENPMK